MNDKLKKNVPIIIAFALPILLLLGVALSTYLPSMFLATKYNFVYASCDHGRAYYDNGAGCVAYLNDLYKIEDRTLIMGEVNPLRDSDKDGTPDLEEGIVPRLFLHNTENNISGEISFRDAELLTYSGLLTSPDGISVESGYDRGSDFFFIFDGSSRYGYYLTQGNKKRKLHLLNEDDRYYYRDNFKFVGWVVD